MNIRVVSTCFNEAAFLPYYLRYYRRFATDIILYDDNSTDGTRDIIASASHSPHVGVHLNTWPFAPGLDDPKQVELWGMVIEQAKKDGVDWLMLPDIDEILYSPDIVTILKAADILRYDVIMSRGYDMVGVGEPLGLPQDDGRQIWEQLSNGVHSRPYGKPIILKPKRGIKFIPGKHGMVDCAVRIGPEMMKLLHYKHLGPGFTNTRLNKNHERVAVARGVVWDGSIPPGGSYGSAEYARELAKHAVNVVESKI